MLKNLFLIAGIILSVSLLTAAFIVGGIEYILEKTKEEKENKNDK
jgi:hypothetical protein